jgi:hypothetical protein
MAKKSLISGIFSFAILVIFIPKSARVSAARLVIVVISKVNSSSPAKSEREDIVF